MAAFGDYNGDNKSQRDIDFDSGYIAGKQSCQAEIESLKTQLRALIANSPQADANTPPDVYDIVVDTGDGIYHTAEVVHFQQSGSKRMIQVRFGDTQADDVRKDAEPSDDKLKAMRDFAMSVQLSHDYDWIDYMRDMYFIAIDKARE